MMINSLIAILLGSVYLFMLEIFGSTEPEVGYFSALLMISSFLLIVGYSVNYIINPLISPLLEQNKMQKLLILLIKAFYIKFILGGFALLLIILLGHRLLGHFGPSYVSFYPELIIITSVLFFCLLLGHADSLLLYSDRQNTLNSVYAGELIGALVLCFYLIPKYNLEGAVIAMVISMTLSTIITTIFAFRLFPKNAKER